MAGWLVGLPGGVCDASVRTSDEVTALPLIFCGTVAGLSSSCRQIASGRSGWGLPLRFLPGRREDPTHNRDRQGQREEQAAAHQPEKPVHPQCCPAT